MNMSGYSSARRFTQIHSEIDSLRVVNILEDYLRSAGEAHHLICGLEGGFVKAGSVMVWRNHKMPARIGEAVQDDKVVLRPVQQEVLLIFVAGNGRTKDALSRGPAR